MEAILIGQLRGKFNWLGLVPVYVGNGWFSLLIDLCEEIEQLYKSKNADINELLVYNIAEKYGTLCFDASNCIEAAYSIIHKYEDMSSKVCEVCGDKARLCVKDNWVKTLCYKCSREMGYRIDRNAGS